MKQIFYFDCFALLSDEWSLEYGNEPAELMDCPELMGFFASEDAATAHAVELEKERAEEHEREWRKSRLSIRQRQRSYYVVPVNQLKGVGDLSDVEDKLLQAARLMASGIGGASLALPTPQTTNI